ncbi:hypothetical protein [Actinokineospora inagensis]|nr:hypothetical protein [Actinokineospora inagensis]
MEFALTRLPQPGQQFAQWPQVSRVNDSSGDQVLITAPRFINKGMQRHLG